MQHLLKKINAITQSQSARENIVMIRKARSQRSNNCQLLVWLGGWVMEPSDERGPVLQVYNTCAVMGLITLLEVLKHKFNVQFCVLVGSGGWAQNTTTVRTWGRCGKGGKALERCSGELKSCIIQGWCWVVSTGQFKQCRLCYTMFPLKLCIHPLNDPGSSASRINTST